MKFNKYFVLLVFVFFSPAFLSQLYAKNKASLFVRKTNLKPKLRLKIGTRIKTKSTFGAIGDTVTLSALLSIVSKKPKYIAGQMLAFYVADKKIGEGKTDKKGKARVKFKVIGFYGKRKLEVKFAGAKRYGASSVKKSFTAIKAATRLHISRCSAKVGSTAFIKGNLIRKTDDKGIPGRKIFIESMGKVVKRATTLKHGRFKIAYKVHKFIDRGINLKVRFPGDNWYATTAKDMQIEVKGGRKAHVIYQSMTGMVGEKITSRVRLTTSDPGLKPIAGIELNLLRYRDRIANQKEYRHKILDTAVTNRHGVATFNFVIDDHATEYLTVLRPNENFAGYIECPRRVDPRYTVKRAPVKITIICPTKKAKVGKKLMFTVRLQRTTDGEAIAGEKIFFQGYPKITSKLGTAVFFASVDSSKETRDCTFEATFHKTKKYLANKAEHKVRKIW